MDTSLALSGCTYQVSACASVCMSGRFTVGQKVGGGVGAVEVGCWLGVVVGCMVVGVDVGLAVGIRVGR
jgi:hypothetical protein